VTILRN